MRKEYKYLIENCRDLAHRVVNACDDVLHGEATVPDACCKHNINVSWFRRMLNRSNDFNGNFKLKNELLEVFGETAYVGKEMFMRDIFSFKNDEDFDVLPDFNKSFDWALEQLSHKEQTIIRQYYMDGKSLSEIAREQGVSRQAIHGTYKTGMAKLRHPNRCKVFLYGSDYYELQNKLKEKEVFVERERLFNSLGQFMQNDFPNLKLSALNCFSAVSLANLSKRGITDLSGLCRYLENQLKKIGVCFKISETKDLVSDELVSDFVTIDSMHFSPRIRNALRRHGIKTLDELLALSIAELKNIRNLGDTSLQEISERLEEYGITLCLK